MTQFCDTNGTCYGCSYSSAPSTTAAECAKCDGSSTPRVLLENRYCALADCGVNQFQGTYGSCYSCRESWGPSATAAECAKCDKSSTPRFMGTDGSCYSCSDSDPWSATKAECAKCDKSRTPREMRSGICILRGYCSEGFLSSSGCTSCSVSWAETTIAAECAKCDGSSTPRYMDGDRCSRCPMDLSGLTQTQCQSCHGTWNAGTKKCS